MSNFRVVNILDFLEFIGEEELNIALCEFSCDYNPEIEEFVQKNAIEFAKRKISVTYLVIDAEAQIYGIFTLAHKALQIQDYFFSASVRKKLRRYAQINNETGELILSAFLIGQFAKNYQYQRNLLITGIQLMQAVFGILEYIQHQIGGGVVYLECEDKPELLRFYQNERIKFRFFGERYSESDGVKYKQLLKTF